MEAQPYENLSDLALLELCIWREARGEPFDGKRGVAHVIRNRVYGTTHWWGSDWRSVILHPYQFSSFNQADHNSNQWPGDADPAFADCCGAAIPIFNGADEDLTSGAQWYHDVSIQFPHSWGSPNLYEMTLEIGRLKFFKLRPTNASDVREAVQGEA